MRWTEFRPTGNIMLEDGIPILDASVPQSPEPPLLARPELYQLILDALQDHPGAQAAVLKLYEEIFGPHQPDNDV